MVGCFDTLGCCGIKGSTVKGFGDGGFIDGTKIINKTRISKILKYGDSIPKIEKNKFELINSFFSEVEKFLFKNEEELSANQIGEIDELKNIFMFCYERYKGDFRKNGEESFIHLLKTALYTIRNFKNPSIKKILIALKHDIIEDGLATFEEIQEISGDEMALCDLVLSKKNISTFLNEEEKKLIIKSGICDKSWKVKKEIKEKLKKLKLKDNEKEAHDIYIKCGEMRKEEYFSRFKSVESLMKYIIKLAKEKNIIISCLDLPEITQNIFDVKLADRCHNLCTQWDPYGVKKIKRKIKETEKYLIPIAKKINKEAYEIMSFYIDELNDMPIKANGELLGRLKDLKWHIMDIVEIDQGIRNLSCTYPF